jgi:hypothetical protein
MNDKNTLLEEVSPVLEKDEGLDKAFLLQTLLIVFMIMLFAFPKLYLQHEIYYKSRKIERMQQQYDTLKAENRIISMKVEQMRFNNQIANTMF